MKFEPAIYEHAAKLIGKTPREVSRSKDLIVQGHKAAFERYHHTPVVVGIDIYNLEAEAFGSVIAEPEGVKVFGVDDSPLCTVGPGPISSVSQQIEETGAQAVSMILKRISKEPTASVAIQPVLRLRASSGD
jgi:DNA-binding LacI/PurR family transcriptional regulator